MQLNTILHPTDFSESASRALRIAAQLARAHNATLHIFHARTLHGEHLDPKPGALDEYTATARGLLAEAPQAPSLEVVEGRAVLPFDAIMQAARDVEPDLIVMGTHGHSRFSTLLMGSTAEKVLRHAPCHVLTVKSGATRPVDGAFGNILVPVDFSQWARRGLDGARAIAADSDATINLVHVIEPAPPMYLAGNVSSYFELDPDLKERIETNMRTWSGDMPNSKVMITEGNPALEVARMAESVGADLIVMSTKGLTGVQHVLVGSVTERVCRFSSVPVLVMRSEEGVSDGHRRSAPSPPLGGREPTVKEEGAADVSHGEHDGGEFPLRRDPCPLAAAEPPTWALQWARS